jgi:glucose-6-phosphate 1-dehydrogenase
VRAFYLAVGPALFGDIAERIRSNGLVTDEPGSWWKSRSAAISNRRMTLNDTLGEVFDEEQIFRIDHYLGKETVQNLMALRFANALYEPLWNSAHIDHVQITVAESVGLEGRAGYYDKAGALRDMVQNHLVQLLCLVAMEPPSSMDAEAVRDEKLKVLRSLKPINEDNADTLTVRGQYKAGASAGGAVKGYLEELEGGSFQHRDLRRHQGGNQQLALGGRAVLSQDRQADERADIGDRGRVQTDPAFDLRPSAGRITANKLVMRLQPDEGVKQWIMIKDPGPGGMRLRHVSLDMSFADRFEQRNPDAYERLLWT